MAVVIETTLGDITVDLYLDQRPVTCLNFLKLCKMKYYNYNLFHTIRSDFIAQTGDPTGAGDGGESIWSILEGPQKRFFSGEKMPKIRHTGAGLLSMVCTNDMMVGSQFFLTLAPDLDSLDGTHCVIGEVTEGHEVLTKLNEVICDESNRPYRDVRITHTVVLEDPFNDPPGLRAPSRSPSPSAERLKGGRIAPDEEIDEVQGKSVAEVQEMIEEKEAKARATILEIVGDLPDADIAPPENVLFVCKLNPVTSDDDLEIIFSRFGKIVSCEVIRDKKTGNSLQYAFIEFENKKSCEDAYFKMDNVLIDDRRIHVDFSQSVSKMRYLGKGRGVQYLNDEVIKNPEITKRNRDDTRDRNDDISRKHNSEDRRQFNKESRHSRYDRDREHREDRDKTNKIKYKSRSRSPLRNQSRERDIKSGREDREKINKRKYKSRSRSTSRNQSRERDIKNGRGEREKTNKRKYKSRSRSTSKNQSRESDVKNGREDREKTNKRKYKSRSRSTSRNQSRERDIKNGREDREKTNKRKYKSQSRSPFRNQSQERVIMNGERSNYKKGESSHRHRDSDTYRRRASPVRRDKNNSNYSTHRHRDSVSHREEKRSYDKHEKNHKSQEEESKKRHLKRKESDSSDRYDRNKKTKHIHKNVEPKTPSPVANNKKDKKSKKEDRSKSDNKKNSSKRKHKKSTSSESDSSDSSSSDSDSSSSSDSDSKKKDRIKRKKRKYSSSSSSDSSSTGSSTSSDTSSDSSSSSSESEPSKKRAKKKNNKSKKSKQK